VLLGLKNRAGCIFSLLLNAFQWRLRFKIWNWVGTLSDKYFAEKLKVPTII
jgi:hypothetical protein